MSSDLISSTVDANTERFMTIPKSTDRKHSSPPSPARPGHSLLAVDSQQVAAAPQSYNDMDCCQTGTTIEHDYPKKRVRIHPQQDPTSSMPAYLTKKNGYAAIFWCAGCEECLLAAEDTKLLYCSECGTLTPTTVGSESEIQASHESHTIESHRDLKSVLHKKGRDTIKSKESTKKVTWSLGGN
jgi:hypothetical protein